jgi:hypothetical protein
MSIIWHEFSLYTVISVPLWYTIGFGRFVLAAINQVSVGKLFFLESSQSMTQLTEETIIHYLIINMSDNNKKFKSNFTYNGDGKICYSWARK